MRRATRTLAIFLIISHVALAWGQSRETPATTVPIAPSTLGESQLEGKVVWGVLLLKLLAPTAMDVFVRWLAGKISVKTDSAALRRLATGGTSAVIVDVFRAAFGAKAVPSRDIVLVGATPNAGADSPDTPLTVKDGRENYQGAHLALVGVDGQGNLTGFHPLAQGFRTGERFKLRVVSTYDALVVLENITPHGERRQIYPAEGGKAVFIKAGEENLLPLGRDLALQFAGATGDDRLVVTVRDPRSLSGTPSTGKVSRQDHDYGSNFLQSTAPGTYPVIAESISIRHYQ